MPAYRYTATDDKGKKSGGVLEAPDETTLQHRLRTEGRYLVSAEETKGSGGKPLKSKLLADFARQVGSLVGAGVSLVRALSIISEEEEISPRYRKLCVELTKSVRQGTPLSRAMEDQGSAFPPLMIYMFRSAEASGSLETTAIRMADYYDRDNKLASKVSNSLMYPKILGVIIILVVAIIMGYVMPQFEEMFAQMAELPAATKLLFGISDLVENFWWLIIPLVIAAVVILKVVFRMPGPKRLKDQVLLKLPAVGPLMKVIYTARFSRTLSSLYSCGISIINALQIARDVVGNSYIESQFDDLIAFVRSGRPLSEGVSKVDGFNRKLSSTVRVGEESGNLESLLLNIADTFDYDSEMSLNKLVALIEPAMIVLMAVIIGFIMFAVLMPIYGSYSTIA